MRIGRRFNPPIVPAPSDARPAWAILRANAQGARAEGVVAGDDQEAVPRQVTWTRMASTVRARRQETRGCTSGRLGSIMRGGGE